MPPITQQSSRAGLITAVVIFVILFVTATIFAIYYGVDANRQREDFAIYKAQFVPRVLPDGFTTSPQIDKLESIKNKPDAGKFNLNGQMPLFTVVTTLSDNLKALVDPTAPDAVNAINSAHSTLAQAVAKVKGAGVTLAATDNLTAAVNSLSNAVVTKENQIKELKDQLAAASTEAKQKVDELAAASDKMAKDVDGVRAQANEATAQAAADRQAKQGQIGELEANRDKERAAAQEAATKLSADIRAKTADLDKLNKQLATVSERLSGQRISTNEPILRAADGTIVRVPGTNIVYISRGSSDQIVPGMTFEVYDKNTGIPHITSDNTNNDALPEGKASIEVIRVADTTSECRVTHTKPGSNSLQEGDLIANLVYDPNVKYNFFVYGKFDLDQNGVGTDPDREVIKRLITQWGGKLQNQINVDTDFVIMGQQPVVNELNEDEKNDPIAIQKQSAAQADLNNYQQTLTKAKELHIPILNQNRFLYLIGYFDQAKHASNQQ